MKKMTILAAMALVATTASAQYTCDPTVETVLAKGKVTKVMTISLDASAEAQFAAQGATIIAAGPNDMERNFWIWDNTFSAGDSSLPGVGDQTDGYVSLIVGTAGWSGAGYNVADPGVDTSWWNDDTRFHLAYYSPATAPASIAMIINDADGVNTPAKVSLGDALNDNGAVYPAIGPKSNDDWQGIDISFADLKRIYPAFVPTASTSWKGNILSVLAGGVAGQTLALDAIYFYQLEDQSGVQNVAIDENLPVVYYNLQGVRVDNPENGIFIARQGSKSMKVVK